MDLNFVNSVPKVAFLFIIYIIIAGNYTTHVLSCQMQQFLETSIISRHLIGVLVFFFFIMLEGGWDFDENVMNEDINNWASGNTIHSLAYAFLLYTIFILIARSKLLPNILLFTLLFILYIINVNTTYLAKRNRIKEKDIKNNRQIEKTLIILSIMVFLFGFIDYIMYQVSEYKSNFSIVKFFIGNTSCAYRNELKQNK